MEIFDVPGSGLQYVDNSTKCWYDPMGRLYKPCENGSPTLGMDGQNAVRTGQDSYTYAYTFVQGPSTDDPLFGYNPGINAVDGRYLYYVTDGQGRQYVVADTQGISMSGAIGYYGSGSNYGGKYAGGTTNASSFGATRNPNELGLGELSSFRNRFYDQRTGRWTQEDPIGVAGGLNLYGYVGNNPVAYTDPFGLCPPEDNIDGPWCKVAIVGGTASFFFVLGATVSAGRYISGEGEGWFMKIGLGAGLEAGGGVEAGTSKNRAALSNGALELAGSAGPVGAGRSWNKDGTTTTGSLVPSIKGSMKFGAHLALTATLVSKPERPVDLRPNFDCSKPHPHNHVCSQ
jgi:RHS repeat-associated protein